MLVATGCASRLHGDVNFDPGQDFSRSQKLAFAKPSDTAEGRQVQQVVQQALVDKGYPFTRREEADLLITTWAGVRVKTATSGWLGSASGSPEGSLMIGFRHDGSSHNVWSGWVKETWRESEVDGDAELRKAVALLLGHFPPRGRSGEEKVRAD